MIYCIKQANKKASRPESEIKMKGDESNGPLKPVRIVRVKSSDKPKGARTKPMVNVSPL